MTLIQKQKNDSWLECAEAEAKLLGLGLPEKQIEKLKTFANLVEQNYVVPKGITINEAYNHLIEKLNPLLSLEELSVVVKFIQPLLHQDHSTFFDGSEDEESGYNSAQVPKALAKKINLLSGVGGYSLELKKGVNGKNVLLESWGDLLPDKEKILPITESLYKKLGNKGLLFPGVTVYNENLSLYQLILNTLLGNPLNSVRLPTGIGGLRNDKYWNYCLNLEQFTNEKISIDGKYYPGMAFLNWLFNTVSWQNGKKSIQTKVEDISNLCHVFIPSKKKFASIKKNALTFDANYFSIIGGVIDAYHVPTHLYASIFDSLPDITKASEKIGSSEKLYTFNSIFHLPFAGWDLGGKLTGDFIGRLKTEDGYGLKCGFAKDNRSVTLNLYIFNDRQVSYELVRGDGDFKERKSHFLRAKQLEELVSEIKSIGYLNWALKEVGHDISKVA